MSEYKKLLEELDNKNLYTCMLILKNICLSDEQLLEVIVKCIENKLLNLYMSIFNKRLEEDVFERIKDLQNDEVFDFLIQADFFNEQLMYRGLKYCDNIVFHKNVRKCAMYYQNALHKIYNEIFVRRKYEELIYFINLGDNLGNFCGKLLDNVEDDKIKELYEIGLFKNDIDIMTYHSIFKENNILSQFFIEKGADMDKVREYLYPHLLNYCEYKNFNKIEHLLKFNFDVNKGFKTFGISYESCIDKFMREFHFNDENGKEIANLLFQHTKKDKLTENFIRLFPYFDLEDIKRIYDGGFHLDVSILKYRCRFLTKNKLSLLNDLDDNFIDFLKINLKNIKEGCREDAELYIESLI